MTVRCATWNGAARVRIPLSLSTFSCHRPSSLPARCSLCLPSLCSHAGALPRVARDSDLNPTRQKGALPQSHLGSSAFLSRVLVVLCVGAHSILPRVLSRWSAAPLLFPVDFARVSCLLDNADEIFFTDLACGFGQRPSTHLPGCFVTFVSGRSSGKSAERVPRSLARMAVRSSTRCDREPLQCAFDPHEGVSLLRSRASQTGSFKLRQYVE